MTREEAIKVLSSYDVNGVWADVDGKPYNAEEQAEAFDMAIEALKVDIVHCEECKHWKDYECHCESASTDHEGGASYSLDRDANDYCSFGERGEL